MKKLALFAVLLVCSTVSQHAAATSFPFAKPQAQVVFDGLPPIGQWMLDENGQVAHWLGHKFDGKTIDEPINVVIQVSEIRPEIAEAKLVKSMSAAGYILRKGHSTGYKAILGDKFVEQISSIPNHAFSDRPFLMNNNHVRLFGPFSFKDKSYFTASASREAAALLKKGWSLVTHKYVLLHPYLSFNKARDDFSREITAKGGARFVGAINLQNKMPDNSGETTGDHDGYAVILDL